MRKLKRKLKLCLFLIVLVCPMLLHCQEQQEVKNLVLNIPILLPETNTSWGICIRRAIEMGFEDIKSEKIEFTSSRNVLHSFVMNPIYELIGDRTIDTVIAMNKLHPFNPRTYSNTTLMKRATIGAPKNEQTNMFSDFGQVLPNIQYAYSEINEPYDATASLYLQTSPSITGQFYAARAFMENYDWKQAVIVYDFSDNRYRLSSNLLVDVLHLEENNKTAINVSLTRIRSYSDEIEQSELNELQQLPRLKARIVFLLASIPGIRQTFCQAYHLQLQKSEFVWILFEELPIGWASSRYDPIINENKRREINCTEEQLLSVLKKYIYFTKGGFRQDNKTSVSGMTITDFKQRLKQLTGLQEECNVSAAYAYDTVWAAVKSHQEIMKDNGELFYRFFVYLTGLRLGSKIRQSLVKTSFEGITGHVSFKENKYSNNVRVGFSSIYVQYLKDSSSIFVGNHDTSSDLLTLIPEANSVLFENNVPQDTLTYRETIYQYPNEFIIVIWLLAVAGIVTAIGVTLVTFISEYNINSVKGNKATLAMDSITSFGCILCYGSLIVYGIDKRFVRADQIVAVCYGFLCTLSIGFTLTVGSLFAKTWWNYKSYSAPSAIRSQTGSKISEWSSFILIVIFLLVDVIVIICWTVTSPFRIKYHKADETFLSFGIEILMIIKCTGDYIQEFTIGMFCYKGVVLLFGVFLAWQTNSKLRGSASYSKTVSLAIYNTALVSVVGVICVLLLKDTNHRHALYAIIAVCVVLCTTTTLAMIYIPKLSKIFNLNSDKDSRSEVEKERRSKKFNKFTLEKLRRRVTNRSNKLPSVSSMQTSNLSISTTTSSLDSRRTGTTTSQTELAGRNGSFSEQQRASSFTTDSSSNVGSFVSYNPSLVQSSTVLEVPSEEEEDPMNDIVIENPGHVEDGEGDGDDNIDSMDNIVEQT